MGVQSENAVFKFLWQDCGRDLTQKRTRQCRLVLGVVIVYFSLVEIHLVSASRKRIMNRRVCVVSFYSAEEL